MREAYRNACEEAEYENGHDGYNGTISTTSGFKDMTMVAPKPGTPQFEEFFEEEIESERICQKRGLCIGVLDPRDGNNNDKSYIFFGWAAE